MKTKIVIISETIMDGVGKHIVDVVSHIDLNQVELTVIHSSQRLDYRFYEMKVKLDGKVNFVAVPSLIREIHPVLDLKSFWVIFNQLKRIGPDIVHCHSSKAGVVGRIAAKLLRVKQIFYTPHAYAAQNQTLSKKKMNLYLKVERFLANWATTLTLNVSEGERQFALDHNIGTSESLKVLYNSIEKIDDSNREFKCGFCYEEFKATASNIVIGTVARLYTQKNPFEFLSIAEKICRKFDNVIFVWIGEGEFYEDVVKWVKSRGLADRIHFPGHKRDVENYHIWFDIYLSSSLYEGLPYTLIESLSAHTAVVASNVIGNNELVMHEQNGYIYELGDIESAARYIEYLCQDKALRDKMASAGYEIFENKFTLDSMLAAYESLYGLRH